MHQALLACPNRRRASVWTYLVKKMLLAIACIKLFWPVQIGEEQVFGHRILIPGFNPTCSHPGGIAPVFYAFPEKIEFIMLTTGYSDS